MDFKDRSVDRYIEYCEKEMGHIENQWEGGKKLYREDALTHHIFKMLLESLKEIKMLRDL
jgi:hypothetical protein